MILVDTSIWIDFLRGRGPASNLQKLLTSQLVVTHPWIHGELMMGSLGPKRKQILADISFLPTLSVYAIHELEDFVEERKLYETGLSLVDAQLLFAAIVEKDCLLWTRDKKLHKAAARFGLAYSA